MRVGIYLSPEIMSYDNILFLLNYKSLVSIAIISSSDILYILIKYFLSIYQS